MFSPTQAHRLTGIERSDSFVWNLHKMMGMTQQCTALLVKRPEQLSECFATRADYLFQPDKQFAELVREGPVHGIHMLIWCDTVTSLERTFDRQALREFDNRVLFQMGAPDSTNLIDSPAASKLGLQRALLANEEQGTLEKFRPYAVPDDAWLA